MWAPTRRPSVMARLLIVRSFARTINPDLWELTQHVGTDGPSALQHLRRSFRLRLSSAQQLFREREVYLISQATEDATRVLGDSVLATGGRLAVHKSVLPPAVVRAPRDIPRDTECTTVISGTQPPPATLHARARARARGRERDARK